MRNAIACILLWDEIGFPAYTVKPLYYGHLGSAEFTPYSEISAIQKVKRNQYIDVWNGKVFSK